MSGPLPVLLAAPTLAGWEGFVQGLVDCGARVGHARTGLAALESVTQARPVLVVADEGLPDLTPLQLVLRILGIDAAVNAAVVSSLSEEDFHEKAEGLGVLAQLPPQPGERHARELLARLEAVLAPTTGQARRT
ncbi:hypothetical protein NNJEOMEG_02301 [Fundidesulfovibrio magnetotacticus]|uniref:Response regulatory domain-containing protein n=1 Tax=Fundidesulfovibrio magnetotacticus TaxID=2730080 RepID=A0A6V8LXC6_9BACT|nr:hypothetical protein [Fundidesulfovibrio magnetotacticus]GFK94456.1 hypothetical protein NNJEOMEG_02301 [Fundidesulfovibrio magnetotacticus]